jgi:uncharacterized membrane protein
MFILALAVTIFALTHLAPVVPSLKQRMQGRLGRAYGPFFGVVATVCLLLIVLGWRSAEFVPVYDPPAWGRIVTFVLVLVAFLCLGIFIFRGHLRQKLRSPLAIGVALWATGHLFANGDLASLILFGGLLCYAVVHLILACMSGYRPSEDVRGGHDVLSLLGGAALYGLMIQVHGIIIGVPVFQLH